MPSATPLLVALALLALASGALAQPTAGDAPLAMKVDPAAGEARAGGSLTTTLHLANRLDRPLVMALGADAPGLRVAFEPPRVEVPAGGMARVLATVQVPAGVAPGERALTFLAEEIVAADAADAAPARAKVSYALRVVDAAPLPRVTPDALEVHGSVGEPRVLPLRVENPSPEPRRFEIRFEMPAAWAATAERTVLEVPARGARVVNLTFLAAEGAQAGRGVVMVGSPQGAVQVPVALRLVAAPEERPPVLRVEPEVVELARGGRAQAMLVVTNLRHVDLVPAFRLALPEGVQGDFLDVPDVVPAGATVVIPFELVAAPEVQAGEERPAGVVRPGARLPSAGFTLRFTAPGVAAAEEPGPSIPALAGLVALGAAGLGGAAAGFAWLQRRWPLALAGLYTRLLPSSVLAQPLRERIAQTVRERPGIRFGDLRRALGMGAGTLTHHARVLEEAGVLFSTPDGQSRRFYAVGHGRVAPTPPLDERALQTLRERGPMTAADLARALGVSRQALHYHLRRMSGEGRLVAEPRGRETLVRAAEAPGA